MTARIIIADDHAVVRQGLRDILKSCPGLEIAAEAVNGVEAEDMARSVAADLLLLDIGMPLRRGVTVCERLRADGIRMPVVFFTMYPPSQYIPVARKIGAQGFIGKDAASAEILKALDQVLGGNHWFPPESPSRLATAAAGNPFSDLSARELEVCQALLAGASLTRLSQQLNLSIKTLSTYRHRVLNKLGLGSNAELVSLALLYGLL